MQEQAGWHTLSLIAIGPRRRYKSILDATNATEGEKQDETAMAEFDTTFTVYS